MLKTAGEVESTAERVTFALEDDYANLRVLVRVLETPLEPTNHLEAQGVVLLRAVQGDRRDSVGLLVENFVGHV